MLVLLLLLLITHKQIGKRRVKRTVLGGGRPN